MIIDFQHHYVPPEVARRQGLSTEGQVEVREGGRPKVTLHRRVFDLELQIREMDAAGLDVAALSCFTSWDASLEDCRATNDGLAEAQARYPARFAPLASIPVHEPAKAIPELDRAIGELGLRGVSMMSQVMGKGLDSPEFFPVYEAILRHDIPIFVHPAMAPKGYALAEDHDLGRIIAREFDLCLAAIRVIAGGVLETFPEIKFVIGHFGGGIGTLRERVQKRQHRFDRKLKRPFDEYLAMLYFDTAGFEGGEIALAAGLEGLSPDQLVFATDYPQDFTGISTATGGPAPTIPEYIERIRGAVSATEAENIFGNTPARLLKL